MWRWVEIFLFRGVFFSLNTFVGAFTTMLKFNYKQLSQVLVDVHIIRWLCCQSLLAWGFG